MAHRYDYVYAAVGLHPEDLGHVSEGDLEEIYQLAQDDKVVAIGEIGLDYYNDEDSPHERQQTFLIRQLAMARELKLPVIIHDREAHEDMTRLLLTEGQACEGFFIVSAETGPWLKPLLRPAGTLALAGQVPLRMIMGSGKSFARCLLTALFLKQIRLIWPLFLTAGNAITRFM